MRVVISAYACEPGNTSERGLGWLWASAASRHHEIHLVTRRKFEPTIARALSADATLRITPIYVEPPRWLTWWKRGERGLYPFYLIWQVVAWRTISRLHRDKRFDVGHHITFALDWLPAGVAFVPELPVVWGPVGPGVTLPPLRLGRVLGARWVVAEIVRAVGTASLRQVFGRATAQRSAVVVGNNREVGEQYSRHPGFVLEQHAVVDPPLTTVVARSPSEKRHAICVGRLVTWKGLDLAIEAIARSPGWTLSIYGTGPAEKGLRRRVARLGLDQTVRFHGSVPHLQILDAMTQADLLVFPSVRDSAPGTVAEAVTLGLPVLCLDIGGPAAMVGPGEGIRIPANSNVVAAMVECLDNPPLRHRGSSRWSSERLGPLIDDWYNAAVLMQHSSQRGIRGR